MVSKSLPTKTLPHLRLVDDVILRNFCSVLRRSGIIKTRTIVRDAKIRTKYSQREVVAILEMGASLMMFVHFIGKEHFVAHVK